MYHETLRMPTRTAPEYPVPSHCWLCGRFGRGRRTFTLRWCNSCGVRWHALLPGTDPAKPVNRDNELAKLRRNYMPRSLPASPGGDKDIFDDFLDHATVKLTCPA